jgi:hypothetical protein
MSLTEGAVPRAIRGGLILTGLLALAVCGCGKKTGTVSGVVTFQGKPLPGGYVNFNTLDKDGKVAVTRSAGIEQNGSYKASGVPTGPAKITVQAPAGSITQPKVAGGMPFRGKPPVVLPDRYGSVDRTDLQYDVTAGPQTYDIDLK